MLVLIDRLNTKLESQGLVPMTDLVKDFSDGVKLIQVSTNLDVDAESIVAGTSHISGHTT